MTRYSQLASPAATRTYLEQWGLHAKKSLGQHFLVDDGVVGRILRLADVQLNDCIIEVGPGVGTLTMALLAQKAKVCAIEKDQNLLEPLAIILKDEQDFTLVAADALDLETVADSLRNAFATSISDAFLTANPSMISKNTPTPNTYLAVKSPVTSNTISPSTLFAPFKLIANLPYAVAATIVLAYFERFPTLFSATIMVQREVAERMMAEPGTKDYGAYTVKLRMLVKPCGSFAVARTNFMPQPRVDSMVVRLDRLDHPDYLGRSDFPNRPSRFDCSDCSNCSNHPNCSDCPNRSDCPSDNNRPLDNDYFFDKNASSLSTVNPKLYKAASFVTDAAFAQRRKTIRNSMRAFFSAHNQDSSFVDILLEKAGVNPNCRGETLSVAQFLNLGLLYDALYSTSYQQGLLQPQ